MCCGGNAGAKILNAKIEMGMLFGAPIAGRGINMADSQADVRLEFKGPQKGGISYTGKVSGRVYRAGNNDFERYLDAAPEDVEFLTSLAAPGGGSVFQVVDKSVLETPQPEVVTESGAPVNNNPGPDSTPAAPVPDLTPGVNPAAPASGPEQAALNADLAAAQQTATADNLDKAGLLDNSKSSKSKGV